MNYELLFYVLLVAVLVVIAYNLGHAVAILRFEKEDYLVMNLDEGRVLVKPVKVKESKNEVKQNG